jgi:hypothetical protein
MLKSPQSSTKKKHSLSNQQCEYWSLRAGDEGRFIWFDGDQAYRAVKTSTFIENEFKSQKTRCVLPDNFREIDEANGRLCVLFDSPEPQREGQHVQEQRPQRMQQQQQMQEHQQMWQQKQMQQQQPAAAQQPGPAFLPSVNEDDADYGATQTTDTAPTSYEHAGSELQVTSLLARIKDMEKKFANMERHQADMLAKQSEMVAKQTDGDAKTAGNAQEGK